MRSRLDKLEKILKRMKNILKGQTEQNLGLGVQQGSSNGHKGLGYKPKAKKDEISYHRVPYSYGTNPKSKGQVKSTREVIPKSIFATKVTKTYKKSRKVTKKVTREAIPRVDLEKVTKASKKPNKVTKKVSREVIPSEYLEHPRSTNMCWVPRSIFSTP